MDNFKKNVLITETTSGIGYALANRFPINAVYAASIWKWKINRGIGLNIFNKRCQNTWEEKYNGCTSSIF